ncbi:hypothetical protein BH24ACT26_BH24ACT26_12430 [soil metagenome]
MIGEAEPIAVMVIHCTLCGLSVQGNSEEEVVAKAADHVTGAHGIGRDRFFHERLTAAIERV